MHENIQRVCDGAIYAAHRNETDDKRSNNLFHVWIEQQDKNGTYRKTEGTKPKKKRTEANMCIQRINSNNNSDDDSNRSKKKN